MTDDLSAFVAARLDEDEAAALAVTETVDQVLARVWGAALDAKTMMEEPDATEEHYLKKQRHHFEKAKKTIAVGDPPRVLREVTAKRRVMARHRPNQDGSELTWNREACLGCGGHERWEHTEANVDDVNDCPELRDLAAVYSDHPDFDPNWSTT